MMDDIIYKVKIENGHIYDIRDVSLIEHIGIGSWCSRMLNVDGYIYINDREVLVKASYNNNGYNNYNKVRSCVTNFIRNRNLDKLMA